ncbi:MAG: hypothetical protein HQL52_01155 [Magnetococcales bacterium]|nr:hypothetical protein [Magnetococcales bacterium]
MSNQTAKENTLFAAYGSLVSGYFAAENKIGDSISVFPKEEEEDATSSLPGTHNESLRLSQTVDPKALKKTQASVDYLRRILRREKEESKLHHIIQQQSQPSTDEIEKAVAEEQINHHFQIFQESVKAKDETELQGNPFYELTKLIFRHVLGGLKNLFDQLQHATSTSQLPKRVRTSRPLKEIWRRSKKRETLFDKLWETFGKWLISGRRPLAIILFFGSSLTTARGMNDLLQLPVISQQLGGFFDGSQAEIARYLLSISAGLLLSSAILDFKGRIFHAMAEAGQVLAGIRDAFLRNPRWMVLATLLTLISIKTNYDGIVSIISKKGDLAQQSQMISEQVRRALGNPRTLDANNPTSLRGLGASLEQATREAREKFQLVPEDEVKGVASSKDARKGPRYWGKHFIVHGGFEAGVNDVILTFNNLPLSQEITRMLQGSGLDLTTSISNKINRLHQRYRDHLSRTEAAIGQDLLQLNTMMGAQDYSLGEIHRVFTLEHYQINDIVTRMVARLEANKALFGQVAQALNQLTDSHVALLKQVDKAGGVRFNQYDIEANLTIPEIAAIDALRKGRIPVATHKNFEELQHYLVEAHGLALASLLLTLIFALAISMDLADPLIYGRWTARRGVRDKLIFPQSLKTLKEWENGFVHQSKLFFNRPDVQVALKGLTFPNENGIRNDYLSLLEEINPDLKHPAERTPLQRFWHWFRSLFRNTRINTITGYNDRVATIHDLIQRRDLHFPKLISLLLPGVEISSGLGQATFHDLLVLTAAGQKQKKEQFPLELQKARQRKAKAEVEIVEQLDEHKILTDTIVRIGDESLIQNFPHPANKPNLPPHLLPGNDDLESENHFPSGEHLQELLAEAYTETTPPSQPNQRNFQRKLRKSIQRFRYLLFQKSFLPPAPPFSHNRLGWLEEIATLDKNSLDDMEALYGFIPELKRTLLSTLPKIRQASLEPLLEICDRFKNDPKQAELFQTAQDLQTRYLEIEKETLEMWGVSQLLGDEALLYSRVCIVDLDEMSSLVRQEEGETSVFTNRIQSLIEQTMATLERAQTLESESFLQMDLLAAQVSNHCEEVIQATLAITMRGWELQKKQLTPSSPLQSFQENKILVEQAPKMAQAILERLAEIESDSHASAEESLRLLTELTKESRSVLERVKEVQSSLIEPSASPFQSPGNDPGLFSPIPFPGPDNSASAQSNSIAGSTRIANTQAGPTSPRNIPTEPQNDPALQERHKLSAEIDDYLQDTNRMLQKIEQWGRKLQEMTDTSQESLRNYRQHQPSLVEASRKLATIAETKNRHLFNDSITMRHLRIHLMELRSEAITLQGRVKRLMAAMGLQIGVGN